MQAPEVVRIAIVIPTTPATKQTTRSNSSRVVKTGTTLKIATMRMQIIINATIQANITIINIGILTTAINPVAIIIEAIAIVTIMDHVPLTVIIISMIGPMAVV